MIDYNTYLGWLVPVLVFFGEHWYGPAAFMLFVCQIYSLYLGIKIKRTQLQKRNGGTAKCPKELPAKKN